MNINVEPYAGNLKKNVFTLKPARKDGLVLQLHCTPTSKPKDQNVRFTQACFSNTGQILVCITHKGDTFLINFTLNKFYFLTNVGSCTALRFPPHSEDEVIAGVSSGMLLVVDIDTGKSANRLIGHSFAVNEISFSTDSLCVTSSTSEAIVWDLRNYTKIQVLTLSRCTILKHVIFMPVTNNILACFHDDSIHIWKYGTFELLKQIMPATWNKFLVKSIAFTRNGRAMVLAGHSSKLAIFLTDSWQLVKTVTLPNTIQSIKKLDFISQPFDGGSNRMLSILSSNGIVYFYDMQLDSMMNHIVSDIEVHKYHTSSDGKYIACILTSGLINIYNLSSYISIKQNTSTEKVNVDNRKKIKAYQVHKPSVISDVNKKFKNVLDKEKLHTILKEFRQYPEAHRLKIWSQLLELPNNNKHYNLSINHTTQTSFENLGKEYPIEDKVALKNLKQLLTNLVTWCPFFAEVDYLPVFGFPFVKVFKNEPVLCFEAVCTIIVNWCQHWFEYYPLPPINTLAMIETVLLEHDQELLSHLNSNNVTSKVYAWPLLETVFSEILTSQNWLVLWDHIISNEPSYILMVVVAYNILFRNTLLKITCPREFDIFYHSQNLVGLKKLILKSLELLNTTSKKSHPRQYLNYFKKLELGPYPKFVDYPKAVVKYQSNSRELKHINRVLESGEKEILKERQIEMDKLKEITIDLEENLRMKELENLCKLRFNQEQEQIDDQRKRLADLRREVRDEEIEILTLSRDTMKQNTVIERQRYLQHLLHQTKQKCSEQDSTTVQPNGDLLQHYANLLLHKQKINELLNSGRCKITCPEYALLLEQLNSLTDEIEKIRNGSNSKQQLKQLNIVTGLVAMNKMIQKIEEELGQQKMHHESSSQRSTNIKQLQLEAVELDLEVKKLLQLLDHMKNNTCSDSTDDFHLLRATMKKINEEYNGPASSAV